MDVKTTSQSLPSSSWFDAFVPVVAEGLRSRIVKDKRAEKIQAANPVKESPSPLNAAGSPVYGGGVSMPLIIAAVVGLVVLVFVLRR